jgi:hypothetical protein
VTEPDAAAPEHKEPLYPKLLRLQHLHPNAWQRAVLGEGMAVLGLLLLAADLASAWAPVVLPVAVAAVVKANDVVAGLLPSNRAATAAAPSATLSLEEPRFPGSPAVVLRRPIEVRSVVEPEPERGLGPLRPFAVLDVTGAGDSVFVEAVGDGPLDDQLEQLRRTVARVKATRGVTLHSAALVYACAEEALALEAYEVGAGSGSLMRQDYDPHTRATTGQPRLVRADLPSIFD